MRDLKTTLEQMDSQQPSKYRTMMELPNGVHPSKIMAYVQVSESADNPYPWQVVSKLTTTYFRTRREALDFCRSRGWL